jgi:hypothetical protein
MTYDLVRSKLLIISRKDVLDSVVLAAGSWVLTPDAVAASGEAVSGIGLPKARLTRRSVRMGREIP